MSTDADLLWVRRSARELEGLRPRTEGRLEDARRSGGAEKVAAAARQWHALDYAIEALGAGARRALEPASDAPGVSRPVAD